MSTTNTQPGVLAQLRGLVPKRRLTFPEARWLAELQATHFRQIMGVTEPQLDEHVIADLPRIEVTRAIVLPASGTTQWHLGRWVVALNALEPEVRQRFSLGHELFHVINHRTQQWLHPADRWTSAYDKGEKLANQFAACLLMPKRYVKALVGQGLGPVELADMFGVSLPAMNLRLTLLGLTEPTPRCVRPTNSYRRVTRPYAHHLPKPQGGAR